MFKVGDSVPTFSRNIKPVATRLRLCWLSCECFSLPNLINPAKIQYLTETVLPRT